MDSTDLAYDRDSWQVVVNAGMNLCVPSNVGNELLVCCRGLYLTTHNSHNRQTSMPPAGFEPPISNKGLQTHALTVT